MVKDHLLDKLRKNSTLIDRFIGSVLGLLAFALFGKFLSFY